METQGRLKRLSLKDIDKEIIVEGEIYSPQRRKPISKRFSLDTKELSPHEMASVFIVKSYPKYRNPACLDDDELWMEVQILCSRFLHEMERETVLMNHLEAKYPDEIHAGGANFVPKDYDNACFTLMKLRDCIDTIKSRDFISEGITSIWDITAEDEAITSLLHK